MRSPASLKGQGRALLQSLRPIHWLKNSFVAAPAVFGGKLQDPGAWVPLALALASFSLAASCGYLVNDLLDREEDRKNPRTQKRPVASGLIPPAAALLAAGLLALLSLALGFAGGCGLPVLGYLGASQAYSLVFKRWVLADVLVLTGLYLLRLVGGAQAVRVPPSKWLLLCGGLLALLLAAAKRLEAPQGPYPIPLLRVAVKLLAGATVLAYLGYALRPATWQAFSPCFALTSLPVLYGVVRFTSLALRGPSDPMVLLLLDRPLQAASVTWVGLVLTLSLLAP